MCVLELTRGDGTPFNVPSILEEDIIKLYVEIRQTHPKGVLWFSVTESAVLFYSDNEMLAMVCRVTKATVLCKESIRLCTSPPPMPI